MGTLRDVVLFCCLQFFFFMQKAAYDVRISDWSSDVGSSDLLSPDKTREAFIRDWNLWVRDTATGKETQLTTDGVKDYGYATDNAGWKHTDKAILVWSPDSTKIATFRQDQCRTSTMTLVGTDVGAPKVEQRKHPRSEDQPA